MSSCSTLLYPSNVNDSDLDPTMGALPTETRGRTEMLFSLVRFEINLALRKIVFSKHFRKPNSYPLIEARDKLKFIEGLQHRLEETYLEFCETNIPVCFRPVYTVRLAF